MTKGSKYVAELRKRRREEGLKLLGGKCVGCGSKEQLEFDHIDPSTKNFIISRYQTGKEVWLKELQKCQLLCKPCHIIKSNKEQKARAKEIRHGTVWAYQGRKCRCELCKTFYSDYRKKWSGRKSRLEA